MANIILHQIGNTAVVLNSEDGYVNATAMAAGHKERTGQRKDVHDWLKLKRTKETIEHLSAVTGKVVTELYQVFQGGIPENQGTWIHPRLAVRFGMWLSDDFGLTVENWVADWNGAKHPTAIANSPSKELVAAREIRELTDLLDDNPRLAQLLTDSIVNRTLEKALPAAPLRGVTDLRGVTEIANEMGFKTDASSRVKLGSFIKSLGSFEPVKESRFCNGVLTPINCYYDTPDLRTAIADFFR
jgi:hypothetical protein